MTFDVYAILFIVNIFSPPNTSWTFTFKDNEFAMLVLYK